MKFLHLTIKVFVLCKAMAKAKKCYSKNVKVTKKTTVSKGYQSNQKNNRVLAMNREDEKLYVHYFDEFG